MVEPLPVEKPPLDPTSDRITLRIVVDVKGQRTPLWKALRSAVESCINAFPYLRFVSINVDQLPDPYELTDPDKPPFDWK